ncbi:F0F1-type ATP synthase assembly protein I [Lewinella aquimaris]|uniref:F0F1-type ATP synthase assembly protein I n=1 Tax=Neolewinella aquimaris TaxID=1835722 RepID=A0A840EBQ9_9BACT|nr:AtpZ/AtpI family protein [Neolewinella aquimaris]MBB4078416.1 F0F1-type ATP synthase assembly protein I [Neolewinella aquimaris]
MPSPTNGKNDARAWTKYMGIGAQLIGTIGVCIFIGIWLDGQLGTNPWITILLSLVGVIGGLWVSVKDLL